MPELRYFTESGRSQWRQWLEEMKAEPGKAFPEELLSNADHTRRAPGRASLETIEFVSKFEMAESLAPAITAVRDARLSSHLWPGLWDWLAAFCFESICPLKANGKRDPKHLVLYRFEPAWNRRYRHRIFGPVDLFLRLGSSSRLLIHGSPATLTDWEEQTASRYQISGNAGIAEALFRLYWDESKHAPKRGAASNSMQPGTLRRFGVLVQQFDRTYDLLSIGSDAILELLPKEFDRFKK